MFLLQAAAETSSSSNNLIYISAGVVIVLGLLIVIRKGGIKGKVKHGDFEMNIEAERDQTTKDKETELVLKKVNNSRINQSNESDGRLSANIEEGDNLDIDQKS